MHNSKLVVLLKTLSKEEWKQFIKFIKSPFYNTNEKMVTFCQVLQKAAPNFTSKKIAKQQIHTVLFPKQQYKEIKVMQYMSEMLKLLETFWVISHRQAHKVDFQLDLAQIYHDKGFYSQSNRLITNVQEEDSMNLLDFSDFYKIRFQAELLEHINIEVQEQRELEPNLQEVSNKLDEYFIFTKLKYYAKALNFQRFANHDYEFHLIIPVLHAVETHYGELNPVIRLYYYIVQTLLSPEDQSYFVALKTLFFEYGEQLPLQDLQDIAIFARNYCIYQINQKRDIAYLDEMFAIYDYQIKRNALKNKGQLAQSTYKNIFTLALLLQKFEWLDDFIFQFSDDVSENIFYFNLARLRFHQTQFEEVLEMLTKINPKETEYLLQLSIRELQLKTYYELCLGNEGNTDQEERLENAMNSFAIFLKRRADDVPQHHLHYLNFLRILRKLYRLKIISTEVMSEEQKTTLNDLITSMDMVQERKWLMQKIG